ncbi:MAG: hypothetical protein J6Z35_04875 [Lachnospiraceae bacterium]|nr:hypothetical protein [Lachnospiraceae bacterium]
MKKMIRNKKVKILTTALVAAMTMSMAAPLAASAQNVYDEAAGNLTETVGRPGCQEAIFPLLSGASEAVETTLQLGQSSALLRRKEEHSQLYYQRLARLNELLDTDKTIKISNKGVYHAKNVCLYGRRIKSVSESGEFILGGWEAIDSDHSIGGIGIGTTTYTVSGAFVTFAFSFDVAGGTDFPYSGIFWNDIYNNSWEDIDITLGGTCRMADITITVGGKTVVNEENCSSHDEWTP